MTNDDGDNNIRLLQIVDKTQLQCESKNPLCGFLTFFPKRMGLF